MAFARGSLDQVRALGDLGLAAKWLLSDRRSSGSVAVIGFCMGGTLALDLAAHPEVDAVVCYYGLPRLRTVTPLSPLGVVDRMRAAVLGHWGDRDEGVRMHNVEELRTRLVTASVDHHINIYPGLGHGFLKAYQNPSAAGYDGACASWRRTLEFLRERSAKRAAS